MSGVRVVLTDDHEVCDQQLRAERDRVRVLAAVLPDVPFVWVSGGHSLRCVHCDSRERTHKPTCPSPAAHAIKESLSHE